MGFWSSLATIGGTILGGPVGGLIGGGIASLFGGGGGTGSASSPGGSTNQLSVSAGNPYNSPAVQSGLDTLDASKGYFKEALGGSQESLQGLLGPEVSTVLSQYDNAAKTAAELGPRGGGRTATLAEAPFKKAAAYGTALAGAQSGAAKNLAGIGEAEAGIGNTQDQLNNQFQLGQANINLGQNKTQFAGQQAKNAAYGQLGQGLGGILTNIITGKKAGGSSGGGSGLDSNGVFNDLSDSGA